MTMSSLDNILKELGQQTNFSIGMYKNKSDKQGSKRAREIAKKFIEFAEFCSEEGFELASGMDQFDGVGIASYIAVKHKDDDRALLMLLVPQDILEITEKEDENERSDD